MDPSQLSRWTRFAKKGGIGKCVALQDCVAESPGDLMFLKDDEITVLMQIPDEDGVYLGHCEGIIGRFAATYVQFIGKLKTPVISKRSSSTSKSPRPRSLTPSHKQQAPPSPVPSLSRVSSREGDLSPNARFSSSAPSVPNPLPLRHRHSFSETTSPRSDASAETSHHEVLVTPAMSYSSSSSAQESTSPPTPLEFYAEPHLSDQTRPSLVSDASHSEENNQATLYSTTHSLRLKVDVPDAPRSSKSKPPSAPACDPLGIMRARSQSSDTPASASHDPQPPSPIRMGSSSLGVDHAGAVRSSTMSDDAAGIGLSMLRGFSGSGHDSENDEDEDEEDSYHESSSQSEREPSSLEETVDGFPAPPTQIPTPSSQTTSFVLDARRPASSNSDYSEDDDGASFYDNYCYSRLSISSKMSKSSGYTVATVHPPIPTEPPPPVRRSQDSQRSAPAPPSEPPSSPSETSSVSQPPREVTPPTAVQATRAIPPPLALESSSSDPEPPNFATASITSPLLHTNFGSPQSSPPDLKSSIIRSPISTAFDLRGGSAASSLRQKIESDHGRSSPQKSPLSTMFDEHARKQSQSVVVENIEGDVPGFYGTQPQSPTSPTASTSSTTSEKKKRGGPAPLVVMNPAPPPPYTPRPPEASGPSPTFSAVPAPIIPHLPSRAVADHEPVANTSPARLFLPHPNAPKPNPSPQGPLYGRTMPPPPPLPLNLLVQTMRRATQMRVSPNGLPRFSTIYGSTTQDLAAASGPVLVYFSVDPPNDIPANRARIAAAPPPAPVPVATQNIPSPASGVTTSGVTEPPAPRQGANVIPRESFVPKAGTVRPRSRSFSGFDSPIGLGTQPKEEQSQGATNTRPTTAELPPSSRPNPMAARAAARTARIHQARKYTPSPLALSQTTAIASPSASSVSPPQAGPGSPTSPTQRRTLKSMKSEPSLRAGPLKSTQEREALPQSSAKPDATGSSRVPHSLPGAALKGMAPPIQVSVSESQVQTAPGSEAPFSRQVSANSLGRKPSMDVGSSGHGDSRTQVSSLPTASASTTSLGRSGSLRSKISLSALRARSLRDDRDDGLHEGDTVQVKDTDFELVRPNVTRTRVSDDSSANGKSPVSEGQSSLLRVDSPAMSTTSGGASDTRSPVSPSGTSLPSMAAAPGASTGGVEAHRARELKWISVMASTPSSNARKNKKIRKLLQEGVPASVRYQVWAHLTDSRAKRIEGLYAQLGEREKVPAFADIQRDAQLCFPGDARLSQPNGPLASLLHAYLTMVPDIQYSRGLAFIAGQLLLQSPEEDAFWIFISLMDSHLRPYFSSNAVQLDIDASLFAKAMETVDPTIAKKLFVDMAIPPIRVCRRWFLSLFVEALPLAYFQRVWDIFLSEGMVFLLRVGLAIITCCHHSLIELANSFRLKDDDIRKQRVKLEMQVKLQAQSRLSNATRRSSNNSNGGVPATISLPMS
ncbi:rab-GTPase-TBC domain-containing protein [Russula compacta]|nr:rab-GTPase-TBC domain-containing protein [Russula compacta]